MTITKSNQIVFAKLRKYWKKIENSEVVDVDDLQAIACLRQIAHKLEKV